MLIFEGSTLPDVSIKYMSKTKGGGVQQLHQQPPTPTYEDSPDQYQAEQQKLNMED